VESVEEDLSPIIVAIDDMQRRVLELRSELQSQDLKRIQLRLQGSISVQVISSVNVPINTINVLYNQYILITYTDSQVNQGPLAYARAFLEKEQEYPAQDIQNLKAIYRFDIL